MPAKTPQRSPRRRTTPPRTRFRPKPKAKPKSGLAGVLSALPVGGHTAAKAASGAGGKGKPVAALVLAGAGAVLGGRRLRNKRTSSQSAPVDTPYFPPATPTPAASPGTAAPIAAAPSVAPAVGSAGDPTAAASGANDIAPTIVEDGEERA